MDRYLITIIAEFKSDQDFFNIVRGIAPIIESQCLNFQYTKEVLLIHFKTGIDKNEIFDYIKNVLFGITETFILTQITDNMTVSLPDEIKKNLFDLDRIGDYSSVNDDVKHNYDSHISKEEDDENVALLLNQIKECIKKPTLDQILDKILSGGYQSLSPFEQEILDGYSKK